MSISRILFFIFLTNGVFGQNASVIIDEGHPHFGCLKITELDTTFLRKIKYNTSRSYSIDIFPKESWEKNNGKDLPPMLGKFSHTADALFFIPRFPFQEGMEYVLEINFEERKLIYFEGGVISDKKQTMLAAIYPSTPIVPSNLLKVYLQFSAPMSLVNPYQYIQLLNEDGEKVAQPFLELDPPLWDAQQKRLTLWFDPGRIKSGLSPNKELGAPLEPNKEYTVHVSNEWKDAFGEKVKIEGRKEFLTTLPDYEKPSPESWKIIHPEINSREPLIVSFPEFMDWAVLQNGLAVKGGRGEFLKGDVSVLENETVWCFTPNDKWELGDYTILLSENIEDLAGNNLVRLFDEKWEEGELGLDVKELPILELNFSLSSQ